MPLALLYFVLGRFIDRVFVLAKCEAIRMDMHGAGERKTSMRSKKRVRFADNEIVGEVFGERRGEVAWNSGVWSTDARWNANRASAAQLVDRSNDVGQV